MSIKSKSTNPNVSLLPAKTPAQASCTHSNKCAKIHDFRSCVSVSEKCQPPVTRPDAAVSRHTPRPTPTFPDIITRLETETQNTHCVLAVYYRIWLCITRPDTGAVNRARVRSYMNLCFKTPGLQHVDGRARTKSHSSCFKKHLFKTHWF